MDLRKPHPHAALATIRAKMHRSVRLVRGEEGTVELVLKAKPAFNNLSADEKAEVVAELKALKLSEFYVFSDGRISLNNAWVSQFVTVEVEDTGDWEYDGGDVLLLGEPRYDYNLESPTMFWRAR